MARYYIDLRDAGGMVCDYEGSEFDRLEDALEEAKASARDLVKQFVDNRLPLNESCVEIRDVDGRTVATLTVAEILAHPLYPAFKGQCAEVPKPGHH